MNVSHWLITGIGIRANDIEPRIDETKAIQFLYEQFPDAVDLEIIFHDNDFTAKDLGQCCGFDNLANVLCHCDDTDTLTYGDDGEGNQYFYYPPSMPWHHVFNEPKSENDVIDRIVAAVQKITNMSRDEIVNLIDTNLYVVGTEYEKEEE